jgi:hypothetical protein
MTEGGWYIAAIIRTGSLTMLSVICLSLQEVVLGCTVLPVSHPELVPRSFMLIVEECDGIQDWLGIVLICERLLCVERRKALLSMLQSWIKIAVLLKDLPRPLSASLRYMPYWRATVHSYGVRCTWCGRHPDGHARR